MYEIKLEDKGQDFTSLITDGDGIVVSTDLFQSSVWKGAIVPIDMITVGKPCLIHHPPNIVFGFLKYKVTEIIKLKQRENDT